MNKFLLAVAAILTAVTLAAAADVQKKDVDIKAPDGVNLKGTHTSPGRPGPAVLLLHQCNMDRHAWDGLAKDLAGSGFHVLTMDYRGYGDSGGEHYGRGQTRPPNWQEKWHDDVDAAYAFLLAQKGVDKS